MTSEHSQPWQTLSYLFLIIFFLLNCGCQPAHEAQEAVSTRDDCLLREDDRGSSPDGHHDDNHDDNVDNDHNDNDDNDDNDD